MAETWVEAADSGGILDGLLGASRLARAVARAGGDAAAVTGTLEALYFEALLTREAGGMVMADEVAGRVEVNAARAELGTAEAELADLLARHTAELAEATTRRDEAQQVADAAHRALLAEVASAWRAHAVVCRERASTAGGATASRLVTALVPGLAPRLVEEHSFVRDDLLAQAADAEQYAAWLEACAGPGGQTSDALARVVDELRELPPIPALAGLGG